MAKLFAKDSGNTLNTSLSSYWKLDETSGNAADSIGSVTLTNTGTMTYAAGKINNAAVPSPTGPKYLAGGSNFSFERTQAFSVSAWVKRASTGASMAITSKYDNVNARGWLFYFTSGDTVRFIFDNTNLNRLMVAAPANTSTAYQHIVLTYAGSSAPAGVKIYYNNVSQTITTETDALSATTITTHNFNVGSVDDGAFGTLNGQIDEVGIWTKVLSATEISDLYNGGAGSTITEHGPYGMALFDNPIR